MRLGTTIAAAGLAAASGLLAAPAFAEHGPGDPGEQRYKDIQLLAINDFHGNLEPPTGSSGTVTRLNPDGTTVAQTVGGVAYLATHLAQARQGHDRSVTVAAGDLIGASPLLSGAFHDEPTIEAMNALELDVTSVGNHEFDEGSTELKRMQNGGCRTNPDGTPAADSCPAGPGSFTGADFPFLSANVVVDATGETLFQPYVVKKLDGVKIGFIGMTLKGTPDIVTAAGVQGLSFLDEVSTANKYAAELQREGVQSIVVLLHQGGTPASSSYNYDCNAGGGLGLSGAIVPIAQQISPAVDLIVTGHTHTAYTCNIPDPLGQPRMVTSGSSFGRLYTDIELKYDPRTKDIVRPSVVATNMPVLRDVTPAQAETDIIGRYNTYLGPIANTVVGYIGGTILGRGCNTTLCPASGESPAGDLIADAQLEGLKTDPLNTGGADFAIMNPGGIRGDFVCVPATAPCAQTYSQAFTVQPFTNIMNVISMSGADVITMFGQQWVGQGSAPKVLQVSANVSEVIRPTGALNENRLVSVAINGVPVNPTATYRVAMNEFLGGGGDGFTAIRNGTKVFVGKSDLDVLIAYLGNHSSQAAPYPVPTGGRITLAP
ncbi:bifunctional metallophosphatase/5'-nucleotidase [Cellulomonas sp. P5_E12]